MNNYERFRALLHIINSNELTWDNLEEEGISRKVFSELEMAHLKEIENGSAKDDPQEYEIYKKEFMDMLFK